jgi:hypothetical protein
MMLDMHVQGTAVEYDWFKRAIEEGGDFGLDKG